MGLHDGKAILTALMFHLFVIFCYMFLQPVNCDLLNTFVQM